MENNISNAMRTTLATTVTDYSVNPVALDAPNEAGETFYDFPNAKTYLGYYKTIPELKSAVDNMAVWTVGKGLTANDADVPTIENITGWGEDSFQSILENMIAVKLIVGDSFAEIIRNENGTLINLKPISPERMRIVVNEEGIIVRYEHRNTDGWRKFKPYDILHLCNNRVADEIHGTSIIEACKWVIDARNEAMADWRRILHRSTIRVMYVDVENQTKLQNLRKDYAEAIQTGEVLVLPGKPGEVELKDYTAPPYEVFGNWIQYLENFFYQAVKIPRVIATSQDYTEAASKVGYLTFEPVYTREQTLLEQDIWNQLAIRVKFNRPASLGGTMQEDEEKNTGQTGFQPKEMGVNMQRE